MPQASPGISNYQSIFDGALLAYREKTGKDLTSDPLLRRLESCHSPNDIIALLRERVPRPAQPRSDGKRWTKWLNSTVKVLGAFSTTISGGVSLVRLEDFKATRPG